MKRQKQQTIYRWRALTPSVIAKVNAQIVGDRLDAIKATAGGRLRTADILNDAKVKTSPLHPLFEWNNGKAADLYRLKQAMGLANHLQVIEIRLTGGLVKRDAFVNVTVSQDGRQYIATPETRANLDYRLQILQRGWAELERWCEKYGDLEEYADAIEAIRSARAPIRIPPSESDSTGAVS